VEHILCRVYAMWQKIKDFFQKRRETKQQASLEKGMLVFSHTGEVIRAERFLRKHGFVVAVKGPPPDLRTGCDMIVLFPLMQQAGVLHCLRQGGLEPLQVVTAHDVLLEAARLWAMAYGARGQYENYCGKGKPPHCEYFWRRLPRCAVFGGQTNRACAG
jgi:hypothetical protein